jgi:hypothetical protein
VNISDGFFINEMRSPDRSPRWKTLLARFKDYRERLRSNPVAKEGVVPYAKTVGQISASVNDLPLVIQHAQVRVTPDKRAREITPSHLQALTSKLNLGRVFSGATMLYLIAFVTSTLANTTVQVPGMAPVGWLVLGVLSIGQAVFARMLNPVMRYMKDIISINEAQASTIIAVYPEYFIDRQIFDAQIREDSADGISSFFYELSTPIPEVKIEIPLWIYFPDDSLITVAHAQEAAETVTKEIERLAAWYVNAIPGEITPAKSQDMVTHHDIETKDW